MWSLPRGWDLKARVLRGRITRFAIHDVNLWLAKFADREPWQGRRVLAMGQLIEWDRLRGTELTYGEVAFALGVSQRTVATLKARDGLPVHYIAERQPRVDGTALAVWLMQRPVRSAHMANPATKKKRRHGWHYRQSTFLEVDGGLVLTGSKETLKTT